MKRLISEAFVELTSEEVDRFRADEEFKKDVISAADEVASLSGRTVIVSGPDYELGKFFSVRGFEATEQTGTFADCCLGWEIFGEHDKNCKLYRPTPPA